MYKNDIFDKRGGEISQIKMFNWVIKAYNSYFLFIKKLGLHIFIWGISPRLFKYTLPYFIFMYLLNIL